MLRAHRFNADTGAVIELTSLTINEVAENNISHAESNGG